MTLRPPGMDFLGGYYVFPGGGVRKEDCSEAVLRRCRNLTKKEAQRILGNHLSPELSLGHWVAAIRELFEEVGVLLCVAEEGRPSDGREKGHRENLADRRRALLHGSIDFREFLESEGLLCDAGLLRHFSHWLTPEEFPTRFDTRFYLCPLPLDQDPLAASEEVAHGFWVAPEQALDLCQRGKLPVIFPTFAVLRNLADYDSLESLWTEYGPR